MNEILATLYFAFWEDNTKLLKSTMECDLFFCFTNLMSEIRDRFCRTLDHEDSGITGKIKSFSLLVKKYDITLYWHLEAHNINP